MAENFVSGALKNLQKKNKYSGDACALQPEKSLRGLEPVVNLQTLNVIQNKKKSFNYHLKGLIETL